jgi:alkylhydroperoxidase/carboxymuconolactone decarboxylase family protein YurZ
MHHAAQAGATKDEILESIIIGSYMAMTRSQSYALREYAEMFKDKE